MNPKIIIKKLELAGLDGIAITDYNNMKCFKKINRLVKDKDFLIIPGMEINTKNGHVLGLFLNEEIPSGLQAEETVDKIKDQGGLVIIPHPFDRTRYSLSEKINSIKFDAIEVFNSTSNIDVRANNRALKYAENNKIVGVAGSDAHFISDIGNAGIITKNDDIYRCIKGGKLKVYGKTTNKKNDLSNLNKMFFEILIQLPDMKIVEKFIFLQF